MDHILAMLLNSVG